MTTTEFTPTEEQVQAINLAMTGKAMAVEALAGTGKTSTLRLIAEAKPERGLYLAFNKAIVVEAQERFPTSVRCSTAHSLAFREVGKNYSHRLNSPRMKSQDIARILDIDPIVVQTKFGTKRLAPGFLAGMVMRTIRGFCMTGDDLISPYHVPIPRMAHKDAELADAFREVRRELMPAVQTAWRDVQDRDGRLPFDHNAYLKLWSLGHPQIPTDYVLFDEAQDANPVMLSIVEDQRDHAQIVFVGDRHQQIYEWNGAVNAMQKAPVDARTFLTHSFRFGPEIAAQANRILEFLKADALVTGRGLSGSVGSVENPDVILSRTNATGVRMAFEEVSSGGHPHIVGGADDVISFARGAQDLQSGRSASHPDLVCFDTWGEVQEYVEEDELGADLRLLVTLVDDFTAESILDILRGMPKERDASLVISTAHKAKGREWPAVRLADDFPEHPPGTVNANTGEDMGPSEEELRLLYVAATRAEIALDVTDVGCLRSVTKPAGGTTPDTPDALTVNGETL